jgi:hypothetical protein
VKRIITGLLAMMLVLTLLVVAWPMANEVKASPGWYDSDWSRRSPVTIDNTGNANTLTDYQVKIEVAYDSDMQPGFDDLIFTDSDGVTELSYWVEEKTDSSSAIVWVKVPSLPGSSTKIIYMYYGNPAATSASNGDDTFLFFDDFAGASLDTSKWDNLCDGSGTATIVAGRLRLDSPAGAYNFARVKTKMSFGDVCVQHRWWLVTWPMCEDYGVVDNNNAYTNLSQSEVCRISILRARNHYCSGPSLNHDDVISSHAYIDGYVWGDQINLEENPPMEGSFGLAKYGTTVHAYYNDALTFSGEVPEVSALTNPALELNVYGSFTFPPTTVDYDDVFVRQYSLPEPITSVGSEELIADIEVDVDYMFIDFDQWPGKDNLVAVATFCLQEGASYDLSVDEVTVNIDGFNIVIPAGSFRQSWWGEVYIYTSPWTAWPKVSMVLNFDLGSWNLCVRGADASVVDNSDGVDVTFTIGTMSGSEHIDMKVKRLSYWADS